MNGKQCSMPSDLGLHCLMLWPVLPNIKGGYGKKKCVSTLFQIRGVNGKYFLNSPQSMLWILELIKNSLTSTTTFILLEKYHIQPNYRTVCSDFSKLLRKLMVKCICLLHFQ